MYNTTVPSPKQATVPIVEDPMVWWVLYVGLDGFFVYLFFGHWIPSACGCSLGQYGIRTAGAKVMVRKKREQTERENRN